MRGQAWVCFDTVEAATNAMAKFQGHPFFDKPVRIQYAKNKSDIAAKKDGSYVAKEKQAKAPPAAAAPALPKPDAAAGGAAMDISAPAAVVSFLCCTLQVPNTYLFFSFLSGTKHAALEHPFCAKPSCRLHRGGSQLFVQGSRRLQGGSHGAGQSWNCLCGVR